MTTISKIKRFTLKQIVDIKTYGLNELFRKCRLLVKILLKIPLYIIAVVLCVVIRLLRPMTIIRIGKVPSVNYGDFARFLAVYFCKKKLKIDQSKKITMDLLYLHEHKIFNKQLAKMWKRKLNFFSSLLLDPIYRVNKFIPGWKIHTIEIMSSKRERDVDNLIEKCQPLDFTTEEEIYGKKMLNKFGLKDEDKFVCFAVRDGAYQFLKMRPRYHDWSYHDYRNYDIENFFLAAEELSKRGYYVFRVGVVVEKSFNSNNPKIIDYANSKLHSDFMDVYLGAKCSFCLSTHTGFDQVPYIFRRPIAFLDLPIGDFQTYSEKFLLLTKHHILKKDGKKLSLSEIFDAGLAYAYDTKIFEQKGVELVDYTPDEIKDFVIEMVEKTEFNKKLNPEEEELQKSFKNLFASNVKRFDHTRKGRPDYKTHGQIRCRFSSKFLKENKTWLR